MGSNWPSPRPSYQTASSGSTGIMTWRVRLRFKDSRGSTLELRVCGHASPLLPNTSAGSDPIVAVVFLGDPSVGLQTCLRGKLRSGFLGSADPRRLAPPIPGSGRGPCLPRLKPSPGLLPPCLPSGEDLIRATSHTGLKAHDHCNLRAGVHYGGEGLRSVKYA